MSASGRVQWGRPPPPTSLGCRPTPALLRQALSALRADSELDLSRRLIALATAMSP